MGLEIQEIINMNKEQLYSACHNNTAIVPLILMWGITAIIFLVMGLILLKKDSYGKYVSIYFISMVFITLMMIILILFPQFSQSISDFFVKLFSF